jgi:hypothetical protein
MGVFVPLDKFGMGLCSSLISFKRHACIPSVEFVNCLLVSAVLLRIYLGEETRGKTPFSQRALCIGDRNSQRRSQWRSVERLPDEGVDVVDSITVERG